jgi:hypothetical protein
MQEFPFKFNQRGPFLEQQFPSPYTKQNMFRSEHLVTPGSCLCKACATEVDIKAATTDCSHKGFSPDMILLTAPDTRFTPQSRNESIPIFMPSVGFSQVSEAASCHSHSENASSFVQPNPHGSTEEKGPTTAQAVKDSATSSIPIKNAWARNFVSVLREGSQNSRGPTKNKRPQFHGDVHTSQDSVSVCSAPIKNGFPLPGSCSEAALPSAARLQSLKAVHSPDRCRTRRDQPNSPALPRKGRFQHCCAGTDRSSFAECSSSCSDFPDTQDTSFRISASQSVTKDNSSFGENSDQWNTRQPILATPISRLQICTIAAATPSSQESVTSCFQSRLSQQSTFEDGPDPEPGGSRLRNGAKDFSCSTNAPAGQHVENGWNVGGPGVLVQGGLEISDNKAPVTAHKAAGCLDLGFALGRIAKVGARSVNLIFGNRKPRCFLFG